MGEIEDVGTSLFVGLPVTQLWGAEEQIWGQYTDFVDT